MKPPRSRHPRRFSFRLARSERNEETERDELQSDEPAAPYPVLSLVTNIREGEMSDQLTTGNLSRASRMRSTLARLSSCASSKN